MLSPAAPGHIACYNSSEAGKAAKVEMLHMAFQAWHQRHTFFLNKK